MMNDIMQKVKVPAIGLLIGGILNGLIGFMTIISGVMRFSGILGR